MGSSREVLPLNNYPFFPLSDSPRPVGSRLLPRSTLRTPNHTLKPVDIFDIQSIFEGSETTLTLLVLL